MFFRLALSALESLDDTQVEHKVNWRPQFLILYNIKVEDELHGIQHHEIFNFYNHLKKGKGMCVVAAVLVGNRKDEHTIHKAATEKKLIKSIMNQEKIKGFASVVVAPTWGEGAEYIIQLTGLGGLVPNTILMSWPEDWQKTKHGRLYASEFVSVMKMAMIEEKSVLAMKGLELMPKEVEVSGNLDIWWIIHDGGLLILMSWLLRQHKVWRSTHLRVFTITESVEPEMAEMAGKRLTDLLQKKKLADIEVQVVVLEDEMIEPYTYDWSVRVEERQKYLSHLNRQETKNAMPMELDDLFGDDMSPVGQHRRKSLEQQDHIEDFELSAFRKSQASSSGIHPALADRLKTWDAMTNQEAKPNKDAKKHLKDYLRKRMTLDDFQEDITNPDNAQALTDAAKVLKRPRDHKPQVYEVDSMPSSLEPESSFSQDPSPPRDSRKNLVLSPSDQEIFKEIQQSGSNTPSLQSERNTPTSRSESMSPGRDSDYTYTESGTPTSRRKKARASQSEKFELLNQIIMEKSGSADLVMLNLPDIWGISDNDALQYMTYVECLTKGLEKVMFIHSTGHEVFDLDF